MLFRSPNTRPDIIVVDPVKVIAGLKKTITGSPNITILMEFWPKGIAEAGGDAKKFLDDLRKLGLTLFELKSEGDLRKLTDDRDLISRHQGRKYTNLVGRKEDHLPQS